VLDNGVGFVDPHADRGHGLRGVQERLELVSGRLTMTSEPTQGVRLEALVPRDPVTSRRIEG
jgi:signal transduction histidine kinase